MTFRVVLVVAAAVLAAGVATSAHHSFASSYQMDKTISVEGKIVQFQYRNPHSFLQVLDGNGVRWGIEWGSSAQLQTQKVTRETLKPGDVVVVTGNPGRNADAHNMKMISVLRKSDGFVWGGKPGETFE